MQPSQRILEPLSLTGIIDRSIQIYGHNFVKLFFLSLILYIPYTVSQYILESAGISFLSDYMLDYSFWLLVVYPFQVGYITYLYHCAYNDHLEVPAEGWQLVRRRFLYLSLGNFFVFVAFFGGLALLIIPGLYFMAVLSLVSPVAALENSKSIWVIFHRSKLLSEGYRLKILVLALGCIILEVILFSLTGYLKSDYFADSFAWELTLQTFSVALTTPVFTGLFVITYFDIRVRTEGYDLEHMHENMNRR